MPPGLTDAEHFLVATKCCIFWNDTLLIVGKQHHDTIEWELPGGKISEDDHHMTIAQSLQRELLEEIGIGFDTIDMELFHVQKSYEKSYGTDTILPFIFLCYKINLSSISTIRLSKEHISHKWIRRTEIATIDFWRVHFDTIVTKAFEINTL